MTITCISIAGFDGSAGAGILADLKTFAALECYGTTVLTALTVQNTCGVKACYDLSPQVVREQLEAMFEDIPPRAIKIGMLFSQEIIATVAAFLKEYATSIPIVLDPVMVAKSSHLLLKPDAIDAMRTLMIPLATVVTPNLPEARALAPSCSTKEHMAQTILEYGCGAVLLKGGHEETSLCQDVLFTPSQRYVFEKPRIHSKNTHGTGCTFSAAIASFLAKEYPLEKACQSAQTYVWEAIKHAQSSSIGHGAGPVHHFFHWWE